MICPKCGFRSLNHYSECVKTVLADDFTSFTINIDDNIFLNEYKSNFTTFTCKNCLKLIECRTKTHYDNFPKSLFVQFYYSDTNKFEKVDIQRSATINMLITILLHLLPQVCNLQDILPILFDTGSILQNN